MNLRVGGFIEPSEGSIEEPLTVLAELKRQGLIRHLGVSNVSPRQFAEAQKITPIVCVQNFYNVAQRKDDGFVDDLAEQGIAYVPFFPLGGFTPLQSSVLDKAAASLQVTPMQLALAWLLHRSPNILLIPGTSSVEHLRENLKVATLQLSPEVLADLDWKWQALTRIRDAKTRLPFINIDLARRARSQVIRRPVPFCDPRTTRTVHSRFQHVPANCLVSASI